MSKILVIEDDASIRTLLIRSLEMEGFETLGAINGQVGIELAQLREPDLIICDIMMPQCDGYTVLKELRQNPATASIPFIFLSARADRTDQRHGMNLGADDYITKPFTREELLNAVAARLAKQSTVVQPYITAMRQAAQSLNQFAYQDPLTNLPNRIVFYQQVKDAMAAVRDSQGTVALFHLNLNQFKSAHVATGCERDDRLPQWVAERLIIATNAQTPPQTAIARLSADTFGIISTHCTNQTQAEELATQLLSILAEPFLIDGQIVQLQPSIGVTFYTSHDDLTSEQLLQQADLALRFAKQIQGNHYQVYRPELEAMAAKEQLLMAHLPQALERSQLALAFQPQVNLVTGRIIGTEAFLRWHHPDLGVLSSQQVIHLTERSGLMLPVGAWVLRTACRQAQQWQRFSLTSIKMAVNLSVQQFRQGNLVEIIPQILEETGFSPCGLVLEVTEQSLVGNTGYTIQTLQRLKEIGVQIAIDNFGSGYSSLSQLKCLPIDMLKIDRSFVVDMVENRNDAAIAKAIIAMAQSLNLKVIAEGVETQAQCNFLRQLGCHAIQGVLFSDPVPATALEQLLIEDIRL